MAEFERRKITINPEHKNRPQVLILEAHNDDASMAAMIGALNKNNIGVTIGTLTDGGGRQLATVPAEKLPNLRWTEGVASGTLGGVTHMERIDIPDGRLRVHNNEGISFAGDLVDKIQPIAIITPNAVDPHTDHKGAYDIGKHISGHVVPHYMMDTIMGVAEEPDIIVPLSPELVSLERRMYLAHESQVSNLPEKEMLDVEAVLAMPERNGKRFGLEHAAVLFDLKNTKNSPLFEIFNQAWVA